MPSQSPVPSPQCPAPGPRPLYLVTGGAGFIGSHLVHSLALKGHPVRVLDNFLTGKRGNLEAIGGAVEVLPGDITDPDACHHACEGADFVLHHAARVSVAESVQNPAPTHDTNATGTLNMLIAAKEAGCRRFVYAGSASAYGDTDLLPHREEMTPRPLSPYAVAKHVGELYCQVFHRLYGLEIVVLRYFNVFGPRQDPSSPYSGVIAQFVSHLLRAEPLTIYGDGEQTRDFVPVENVVHANLLACVAPAAAGRIINIGCGERISVNHLARILLDLSGARSEVAHLPPRPGDIRHSVADITRARELLGYQVQVTPPEGLQRTLDWYRHAA